MNISNHKISFGTKVKFDHEDSPGYVLKKRFNAKHLKDLSNALDELSSNGVADTLTLKAVDNGSCCLKDKYVEGEYMGIKLCFEYEHENGGKESIIEYPEDLVTRVKKLNSSIYTVVMDIYNQLRRNIENDADHSRDISEREKIIESMKKKYA